MKLRFAAAAVLLLCVPLAAQETKITDHKAASKKTAAKPADAKASSNASSEQGPPKPSAEMQKMTKAFVGKWNATVTMEATQFGPADKGTGTQTVRRGPGGYSLISDTTMKFDKSGPFSGHGVDYYDPAAKSFTGIWCDSWSPACMSAGTGNWQDDKLVMDSSMEMQGHTLKFHHTYAFTPTGYTYTLEMADASGQMKPWMTFTYTKAEAKK